MIYNLVQPGFTSRLSERQKRTMLLKVDGEYQRRSRYGAVMATSQLPFWIAPKCSGLLGVLDVLLKSLQDMDRSV